MTSPVRGWCAVLFVASTGACRQPDAQAQAAEAALAPVLCFELATDQENLEDDAALQLCRGARSTAPARCFGAADDRLNLVDSQSVQLCQLASSSTPVACAEHLEDTTSLTDQAIAEYCTGVRWPLVVPSGEASSACVERALDDTTLSETSAMQLCRGASTSSPVACYELGDERLVLADADLVELCAPVIEFPG